MSNSRRSLIMTAAIAIAASLISTASMGMSSGNTVRGGAFVSGGIGESEILALDAQRDRFSLWVITAAKLSGAYLADVRIRITDAKKALVLEQKIEGPWLLVDLPLGRFEVEASLGEQSLKRATTIHAGDHHQMVFYFDVAADVLPKSPDVAKK